jgi:hypothetical protein
MLRNAYEILQLDDFGHCEYKMKSFISHQKKFVPLEHELPKSERRVVSEKLEPFLRHWNYKLS